VGGVNVVVQYSGGVGSFAAAKYCVDLFPSANITLLFCDTKTEDEDLYRFLEDTSKFLGIPITTIADGRNVWELFKDRRIIGNSQRDTCSETLKRNLARKWMQKNHPPEDTVMVFGIDWSEGHRFAGIEKRWAPYRVLFPLWRNYDKLTFIERMENEYGIRAPRLYGMGFPHNNCGGFCIKAGKAHFLNLLDKLPERYRYHEEQEQGMQAHLGKPYTILREEVKGVKRYISLKELRERAEEIKHTDDGKDDWGGCGCFA
jgi:hypothetical protein